MNEKKILLVEDDEEIARVIRLELQFEHYHVHVVHDGSSALTSVAEDKWDLILLDIMIPKLNGMEVLRRIRTTDPQTPIILLSARNSVVDKVTGLDQGANDYITKPFQIEELLARIRSSMRQSQLQVEQLKNHSFKVADLIVEEKSRMVYRNTQAIELTKREFDLLVFLLKHKNQVLTREQILETVWGFNYLGETNVVDVYIRYLRKKIDDGHAAPLIHTIRGVGYCIKEPLE